MANCENEKRGGSRGNGDAEEIARSVVHGEEDVKIKAAKEIRMMTKKSAKSRAHLAAAGVIGPLVEMLRSDNMEAKESAVLALLNLAVKNERGGLRRDLCGGLASGRTAQNTMAAIRSQTACPVS